MNTIEIRSKSRDFETKKIIGWEINPKEGEYIQINMKARKIEQVIYDVDNIKIICVVD